MTDRELLELAAKAAGVKGFWSKTIGGWDCLVSGGGHPWQPLHDDGDALRLAVGLWLEVRQVHGAAHAGMQGKFWKTERWFPDGDANAATRRAIVRAAASIGEAMQ